ncbi:radical SAM protein [candidate division KSB3 bacterium]|uniref:Radical SAM protein n=1 Tax=candidate division KSB3 bacterium TaxID=2044937 RepID=A0A9D5Q8H8_9BACT|nr:radical SAM protein [candidate division KSB3 bacterium]MBD3327493.1 radical SAM protein [candidate division KSB3 bacterium]
MLTYLKTVSNILRKPLTLRQRPIHIQLEPTTYCNLNCTMCGRSQHFQTSTHMRVPDFERILHQIQPRKITLSGVGEPFMNPDLLDMIRLAKAAGASINTTTNCTLLTPARCEQIVRSGLDLIKISIDGAKADTYQRIRGEDKFLQVLDGLRALTEAKKRLSSVTPFIRLNYVMSKANYQEIAATIELAAKLGVDAVYFQPLELVGIEDRYELLVGDLAYEDFAEEIRRALALSREQQVSTNLARISAQLPTYWDKYQMHTHSHATRICILPWFSTYITVDGIVRPCCSFSQTPADMGNILHSDLSEIWNGKPYQQFRKAIRAGNRPYQICKNCVPQTLTDILRSSDILPGFLK